MNPQPQLTPQADTIVVMQIANVFLHRSSITREPPLAKEQTLRA